MKKILLASLLSCSFLLGCCSGPEEKERTTTTVVTPDGNTIHETKTVTEH